MHNRKVILYISMSLDGFLAGPDDDISWLSMVEQEGEDYGYQAMTAQVDTYIVGRKTYEVVRQLTGGTFPQAEMYDCYIITRQERQPENGVKFFHGPISELIAQIRQQPGRHIYCDGGGQIVQLLMAENLIDEYIISIVPIVLGNGKRLFLGDTPSFKLKTNPPKHFPSGLVQLHYVRENAEIG